VGVDVAEAASEQGFAIYEAEDLGVRRQFGARQVRKCAENNFALANLAKREFANDKGVHQHPTCVEQLREPAAASAQMIDPDRGIDEDHARRPPPGRRLDLRLTAAETSEPPSAFPFYQRLERLVDEVRLRL
jgi:hypothetical protein